MAGKPILAVHPILCLIILIVLPGLVHTRSLSPSDSTLVSDGVSDLRRPLQFLRLGGISASDTCDETYGFLPCTTTVIGNLFLILVYGYLMFIAATYLSNGSELLLEILGPGIVGGLFLPILGALPDALLILVSGLSGSTATAQDQVSVGIGLLAGSTVMLLTLIWGSCVIVGKTDIERREVDGKFVAVDGKDTQKFSITGSGVTTDDWTSYAARIMVISIIPFIIVQIPSILGLSSSTIAILISLIVSVALLLAYCIYQILQPKFQRRRLAYAKHKHVISGILSFLRMHALGRLFENDQPNEAVIKALFDKIDADGDGSLHDEELKALIVGIHFTDIDVDKAVEKVMSDFDTDDGGNGRISFSEFVRGLKRWFDEAKRSTAFHDPGRDTLDKLAQFHKQTKAERDILVGDAEGDQGDQDDQDESSDEIVEGTENPKWVSLKAGLMLLLGTIIAAVFADPLVDAVDNFSTATSIPSFFISFIALPLATNSSESVSAIIFSSRKKKRTSSLTFSELYGAATMNNLLCLAVFLAIVYLRGLTWDFSAEVLVILIVCIVMGVFASFRTTFPLWTTSIAFLLYPFSLALVYVLDYVLGWS